jgi:hypothetical protein
LAQNDPVRLRPLAALAILLLLGLQQAGVGAAVTGRPPITVRIALSRARVTAGTWISAEVTLTNSSPRAILVDQCAADGWLAVGLESATYHFDPAWALVACRPTVLIKPGVNRFRTRVSTSYNDCLQPGGRSEFPTPSCEANGGMPPLPPGRYRTAIRIQGLTARFSLPPPAAVTLSGPARR